MFYTWAYVVLVACVDDVKYYVNILFCLSVAYNQGMSYRPEVPYKIATNSERDIEPKKAMIMKTEAVGDIQ